MGQPPPAHVPQRPRLLVPRVHAHLHGGGGAHHEAAAGTGAVQTGLHGVVARLPQVAARRLPGIVTETDEDEAVLAQYGADGVEIGGDRADALRQGGGGERTQLQLAAGLDGQRRPQGHAPQRGVQRVEPFG